MKNLRSRNIAILIYNEWENYFDILSKLVLYEYAYIVHKPEQEGKKEHTHVYLKFKNARYISSLSKEFNIDVRFFQVVKNEREFCRYLIHKDNKEKIQYDYKEVITNMGDKIDKHMIDIVTDNEIEIIINNINESKERLTKNDIVQMCIKYNMLGDLRAYWWIIKELLEEHNWKVGNSYD